MPRRDDPLPPVPSNLQRYVDYIRNTGRAPLPVEAFDEDFEPIGPQVRAEMKAASLIYYGGPGVFGDVPEGIYLRPDLAAAFRPTGARP